MRERWGHSWCRGRRRRRMHEGEAQLLSLGACESAVECPREKTAGGAASSAAHRMGHPEKAPREGLAASRALAGRDEDREGG